MYRHDRAHIAPSRIKQFQYQAGAQSRGQSREWGQSRGSVKGSIKGMGPLQGLSQRINQGGGQSRGTNPGVNPGGGSIQGFIIRWGPGNFRIRPQTQFWARLGPFQTSARGHSQSLWLRQRDFLLRRPTHFTISVTQQAKSTLRANGKQYDVFRKAFI